MLALTLDAALARVSAAVLDDERVLAEDARDTARGAGSLAGMAEAVLAEAGLSATALDLVAVTLGPGSFTGIRAALALAHGIGLAAGVAVVGVTAPEALAAMRPAPPGRQLWVAIDSRRGRVFLDRGGDTLAVALDDLPMPRGPLAVAGDAAQEIAARLVARGADVLVAPQRLPEPRGIARAARDRLMGALPPRPAQPFYVDPPETRLPAGGLRPAPAG
ncbi:MAG: tRNA (adenosine(37)-N6)-threonylcarbamoyltransferase complex dimerization subunit type 1 TsaB [Acetobacteraceae bacterium]|nr:tRNA (adenosine(37)-N6)-threonylcarbamoyltransferase complex dimerization subunit type 1 TsaB [Acetobacteraceae bacterium]